MAHSDTPHTLPYRPYFLICGIAMTVSEIVKQLLLTFAVGQGSYQWWYFPFQLCSIPMYVMLFLPWTKKVHVQRTLLCFLMSYCLLGGIAVFADTSGMQYTLPVLTLHSYLWHIVMILSGILAGMAYCRLPEKDGRRPSAFLRATLLYLLLCLAATCINLLVNPLGLINMFYINPKYEMNQVVFSAVTKHFGNAIAICVYILATILGAWLLYEAGCFIHKAMQKAAR